MGEDRKGRDKRIHQKENLLSLPFPFSLLHDNYMPPVEMLEELSNMYNMTINELLSGRKLTTEEYKEMAETNIKETLKEGTFTLKEKQAFFKKKWLKEHAMTIVIAYMVGNGMSIKLLIPRM